MFGVTSLEAKIELVLESEFASQARYYLLDNLTASRFRECIHKT